LADYSREADRFRNAGATLAALSVDDTSRSAPLREQLKLEYLLLCDPERAVVKGWGLLNEAEMGGIAYPAVFVIDRERKIRFRALESVARRVDIKQLVTLVRGLDDNGTDGASQPGQRGVWPGEMFLRAMMNALLRGGRSPRK
jgi:peroxiredoxin